MQKLLNADQVSAFYHDGFVKQQVNHFSQMVTPSLHHSHTVVDVGGGCGYFASAIQRELNIHARVIDMDPVSVDSARCLGVDADVGDALKPIKHGDERIACFNLILHHLVGDSNNGTATLQESALRQWHENGVQIFVNEYIYDSWFDGFSGWLIYQITSSKFLSSVAEAIAMVVPSLHANTFGVGVRFRSRKEWCELFLSAGYKVVDEIRGEEEFVSLPRRMLLIKSIRRDSFLLTPQ